MRATHAEAQAALEHLADPTLKPSEYEFARAVVLVCDYAGVTIAAAESMTGGLITELLTSVPGASSVLRGGVTAYASDLKVSVLNVDAALIAKGGAIQAEVAIRMAHGVAELMKADIGLGISGVAGPEPQDGAPVGTVHVAVVDRKKDSSRVHSLRLAGTRDEIRVQGATALLAMVLDMIVPRTDLSRD